MGEKREQIWTQKVLEEQQGELWTLGEGLWTQGG